MCNGITDNVFNKVRGYKKRFYIRQSGNYCVVLRVFTIGGRKTHKYLMHGHVVGMNENGCG
jgi:hypothetical protein